MSKGQTDDLQTLGGIVERRAKIQFWSFQLLEDISSAAFSKLQEEDKRVSQLLIGCAFSLWRAAFLLDVERASGDIGTHAKKFLNTVIRTNAVTFNTERESKEWSVGYYLNNARYRLEHAATYSDYQDTVEENEFSDFKVGVAAAELWDECAAVLEKQLNRLRQRSGDQ